MIDNENLEKASTYAEIVGRSRNLTKTLGQIEIASGETVMQSLELEDNQVSIWSIYEVVLAIYCFPDKNLSLRKIGLKTILSIPPKELLKMFVTMNNKTVRNIFRLIKSRIKYRYVDIKQFFVRSERNEDFIQDGNNIHFLGFTEYLAKENFELVCKKILSGREYNPLVISDQPSASGWSKKIEVDINGISPNLIRDRTQEIRANIKKTIKNSKNVIKKANLSNSDKKELLKALAFLRPAAENEIPKYIASAEQLFKQFPPSAIVSIDVSAPRNRVFTLLAKKLGIPVVQIQAGVINQECIEWSFCDDDLMLSHGPKVKSELDKLGCSIKVIDVGSAKFETVAMIQQTSKTCLASRFEFSKKNAVVLFLTSYSETFDTNHELAEQHRIYNEIYSSVVTEAAKRSGLSLVIKPHPLESLSTHTKTVSKHSNLFLANSKENTSDLIAASDVVISFGSTATIDAILMGKAAITPHFNNFALNPYFAESSATLKPKNKSELASIFDVVSDNKIEDIISACAEGKTEFLLEINNSHKSSSDEIISQIYQLVESY